MPTGEFSDMSGGLGSKILGAFWKPAAGTKTGGSAVEKGPIVEDAPTPTVASSNATNYLDAEAELGSRLFGAVPHGVDRKFFHSTNRNVWIWYENGVMIRYEVRPNGVFKRNGEEPYEKLEGAELANFRIATRQYLEAIKSELYRKP